MEYGLEVRTLRNILKSYRYVQSYSTVTGIAISDIKAAAITIDVLMRIEKKSPNKAFEFRKKVLQGECSYRDMLRLEKNIDAERKQVRLVETDREYFIINIFELLFNNETTANIIFSEQREHYSKAGQLLSVDWEGSITASKIASAKSFCLFLSPHIAFSQHRGKNVEEQISKVISAQNFFDRVVYLLIDKDEESRVESYRRLSPAPDLIRFEAENYDDLLPKSEE